MSSGTQSMLKGLRLRESWGPAFGNLSHYRLLDSLYPLQGTCTHLMLAALFPKSDYEWNREPYH